MADRPERYTITAALPYANGPLHIGHIAGAYLPADIFVRYLRAKGEDVAFICGSDEHGAAITMRAKREGVEPRAIIDKYHEANKKAFEGLNIDFDIFHRTSESLHHETAQDFFLKLHQKGEFVKHTSEQYYDPEADQFLADRYITGTCPKCQSPGAYGDQCESCGASLSPNELIDPISVLTGNKPELRETSHWYLPMQDHEDWLREYIRDGKLEGEQHHDPKEWKEHVKGQCMSWIDGGLHERAMTRDLDWGVKVPLKDAEGKVLYVWLDAPIGYISATKQWATDNNKNWEEYWKKADTKLIHFIGKDNIVFHCIIFPIILKCYNEGFLLPHNVPANGFLNLEGGKISTSRNWAVWVEDILTDMPDRVDVFRYALTANAPENRDSEFTWEDLQNKNNNELVGVFGNFVNRAIVLTHKYFNGQVPPKDDLQAIDRELLEELKQYPGRIGKLIEKYRFKEALLEAMNLARAGNKYLADTEPWKMIKEDEKRVGTILNLALQVSANLAILFHPFLPHTSEKLRNSLSMGEPDLNLAGDPELLDPGHPIEKGELLFQKIDDKTIEEQRKKLEERAQETRQGIENHDPVDPPISFEDMSKMDIRVGEILKAEHVPKTKKLLKLKVDTGVDQRTIISGIAEYYDPKEVVGKKVTVLLNLAPKKIKGVESEGMILMAEGMDGKLSFISPEREIDKGSKIR